MEFKKSQQTSEYNIKKADPQVHGTNQWIRVSGGRGWGTIWGVGGTNLGVR